MIPRDMGEIISSVNSLLGILGCDVLLHSISLVQKDRWSYLILPVLRVYLFLLLPELSDLLITSCIK